MRNERGATAVEYGLLVAACVVVLIVAVDAFFDVLGGMWQQAVENMDD